MSDNTTTVITEKDYCIQPVWVLASSFPSLIVLVVALLFTFIASYGSQKADAFTDWFMFIFYAVIVPFNFFMNILNRHNFHYSVEDKFINLKQGLISKQNRQFPYGVIQNIILKRGLTDQLFGLASVSIENAAESGGATMISGKQARNAVPVLGFFGNTVKIPGLKLQEAEMLKNLILEKVKANPIHDLGL